MRFEAAPQFLEVYLGLGESEVSALDGILKRLGTEHGSPWARMGRIADDESAWIVVDGDWRLYWEYAGENTILLLALIRRG